MARTNQQAVEEILGKDYDCASARMLTPFIATANAVVTRVAACASRKGISLSSTELELIERWLAAHYYCASDQPYSSKNTGAAGASFQGQTGMKFEGTKYGQVALGLDFSGCLQGIQTNSRVRFGWLGKPKSDQIDYTERD